MTLRAALLACLCTLGLLGPAWAAADKPENLANGSPKKTKAGKKAATRLAAPAGSGETPAERSARLRRECKGRPNAGACSGYTD